MKLNGINLFMSVLIVTSLNTTMAGATESKLNCNTSLIVDDYTNLELNLDQEGNPKSVTLYNSNGQQSENPCTLLQIGSPHARNANVDRVHSCGVLTRSGSTYDIQAFTESINNDWAISIMIPYGESNRDIRLICNQ
jgi:hypothetical protein